MAVTVKFWSFPKKKNSTKVPTGSPSYSYDCQLKTEATLTEPVIELNTGEAKGCSYAQIADFGRYYFIREWRFDRGLWTAYLEVDVLASYKSSIGSQSLYVTRSASSYDGDIKDMFYPTTDAVTMDDVQIVSGINFSAGYFVVGILGDQTLDTGGVCYYQMPPADFLKLVNTLFVTADGEFSGTDWVQGIINSVMNPLQYINSCRWYPYSFPVSGAVTSLKCGNWPCTGLTNTNKLSGEIVPVAAGTITIPKHPKAATRGSYLNLAPFARYAIEWGSCYELDSSLIAKESQLLIRLIPDYTTPDALLKVYPGNSSDNYPILTAYVPYGIDIPLSQSNINPASIADITKAGLAMTTGDPAGFASLISGVAEMMSPTISTTRSGGGIAVSTQNKSLKYAFYDVVDDDLADFGRPLMKTKQISTLSGFVRCQNDDISISCLDSEREKIRSFMTGGFFYE